MTLRDLEDQINQAVEDAVDLGRDAAKEILKFLREAGVVDESSLDPEDDGDGDDEKESFRRARSEDDGVMYGDDDDD